MTKEFSVAPIYIAAILSFTTIFSGYDFNNIKLAQRLNFYMHSSIAVKLFAAFHFWVLILQYVLDDNSMRLIQSDGVSYFQWDAAVLGLNKSDLLEGSRTLATITQNGPSRPANKEYYNSIHNQKFNGIEIQTLYYSLLYLTIPIASLSGYGLLWLCTRLCCMKNLRKLPSL